MKVAIVGAGVAGLACAFELEKYGITPVIYEKKNEIGFNLSFSAVWTKMFVRCRRDPVNYMLDNYNLKIQPMQQLARIVMMSENKTINLKGHLGYIHKRGTDMDSLENQVASHVKTPVIFNSNVNIDEIKNEFDHIVIATGEPGFAEKMNIWTETFFAKARVAIVSGDFNEKLAASWFNTDYCNRGFCFCIPNSSEEATIALIFNDATDEKLDNGWNEFIKREKIHHPIKQQTDVETKCGILSSYKVDNMYFIGNAAGLIDNVFGVGTFNSIESGILAARAIVNGEDYNALIKPMVKDIKKLHEVRMAINKFENKNFDKVLGFIGTPGINQFIYNTPCLKMKEAYHTARIFNKKNK